MREFKKRQAVQALDLAKGVAGVLVLALIAVLAGRAALDMYGKFAEAAAARSGAEAQVAELEGRYVAVKAQVEALSSPRGLEAAVRERYGVARPGEGELDIVRQASSSEARTQPKGLFDRLWDLLFVW